MRSLSLRSTLGCSASVASIIGWYLSGASALAQQAQPNEAVEQIVVTGTSIRGIAPIGSNLITVDPETLKRTGAQTLQQAFADVPALTGMNMIGQGQTNNSFLQPTIHQLGGSSSNATMVIIDGHRSPTGSTNHTNQVDPNIIPFNMVDHVEILADGSSSIYGSDAVTGVINMITRRSSRVSSSALNIPSWPVQRTGSMEYWLGRRWVRRILFLAPPISTRARFSIAAARTHTLITGRKAERISTISTVILPRSSPTAPETSI
jgi:outer membrane receptor for ferrienterochelin and colicin